MLCKRLLRWLGHIRHMEDGRIPKDLLYGELATGCRPTGRPALRFGNVCKRDLKLTGIDTEIWEALALDLDGWRHAVSSGVKRGEEKRILQLKERRERRKAWQRLSCKDRAAEPFETLLSAVPMSTWPSHCLSRHKDVYS